MSQTLKMHNGDLLLDSAGRFVICSGIEKCSQDIAEVLLNNYDPKEPSYYLGSELYKLDRMTFTAGGMDAVTLIEAFTRDAVKRLMEAQENDPQVDEDELIYKIDYLQVRRIGTMTYAFFLKCLTDSQLPAEVGFDISLKQQLPSAVAQSPAGYQPAPGTIL